MKTRRHGRGIGAPWSIRRPGRSLAWALDVAPQTRASLPASGLGHGWEPTIIVVLIGGLLLFGLLTLHSASSVMAQRDDLPHYHYVARQATGAAIGLVAMFVCARVPTEYWQRFAPHLMLGSLALLIVVILPFTHAIAPEVNGARRWLRVGVTVQPSDLAKLAVVVWTASMLVRKRDYLRGLRRGLAPFLVGWTADPAADPAGTRPVDRVSDRRHGGDRGLRGRCPHRSLRVSGSAPRPAGRDPCWSRGTGEPGGIPCCSIRAPPPRVPPFRPIRAWWPSVPGA